MGELRLLYHSSLGRVMKSTSSAYTSDTISSLSLSFINIIVMCDCSTTCPNKHDLCMILLSTLLDTLAVLHGTYS